LNVFVTFLESLFGELSDSSSHHVLLILEEAVRTTEEAIKGDYFLEESKLGISLSSLFLGLLHLDGLLKSRVNLLVNLRCGERAKVNCGIFT